jgi:hypothetical protein
LTFFALSKLSKNKSFDKDSTSRETYKKIQPISRIFFPKAARMINFAAKLIGIYRQQKNMITFAIESF